MILGWYQRPSTNLHDVCKAALVKSQTVNNADLVDIHLAFMNMILSQWGALWLGHWNGCYNQGHWQNYKSSLLKLFPKGGDPQVCWNWAQADCPRCYGMDQSVEFTQIVLVPWLSQSYSLVHHSIHEIENLALVNQLSQLTHHFIAKTRPAYSGSSRTWLT